jgi:hypothetical protein
MRKQTVLLAVYLTGHPLLAQLTETPAFKDGFAESLRSSQPARLATLVVDSTFQVIGNGHSGTAFILFAGRTAPKPYLLVTAAHVLRDCLNDDGTILVRFRVAHPNQPFTWAFDHHRVQVVGKKRRPLWGTSPNFDVAVLPLDVPEGRIAHPLPISILASEQILREDLYFGRDLLVLGYPFGELGISGFPILRPAPISSRVVDANSMIALSFQVYPGDSGGPVYFVEEANGQSRIQIVGVVANALAVKTPGRKTPQGTPETLNFVGVGFAVPSTKILEAIQSIPISKAPGKPRRHESAR